MSASVLVVLVVPAFLALLAWWLDHQAKGARNTADLTDRRFRASLWVYGVFVGCGSLAGASIFWSFDESQPPGAREMLMAIGLLGGVGSISALWWSAKSEIRLTDDELIIKAPFSMKVIRLNQIREVRVAGGMIIVDEGKIPRVVFPIIYRKTGRLVANLEAQRLNRQHGL